MCGYRLGGVWVQIGWCVGICLVVFMYRLDDVWYRLDGVWV